MPSNTYPLESRAMDSQDNNNTGNESSANTAVLNWLRETFEIDTSPTSGVPRAEVYDDYCNMLQGQQPVNKATFGKLLRTVFPKIRTRRLGNRGHSKYYYCGIQRIDPNSQRQPATLHIHIDPRSSSLPQESAERSSLRNAQDTMSSTVTRTLQPTVSFFDDSDHTFSQHCESSTAEESQPVTSAPTATPELPPKSVQTLHYRHADAKVHLPVFSCPVNHPDCTLFMAGYQAYCTQLYNFVLAGQLSQAETCITKYHEDLPDDHRHLLLSEPRMIDALWRWDAALYDTILLAILPSVDATISVEASKHISQFTQWLKNSITRILTGYPAVLVQRKHMVAALFFSKVERYLMLNRTARVAEKQMCHQKEMAKDWQDLTAGSQQLWLTDTQDDLSYEKLVHDIGNQFSLSDPTLTAWMSWIKNTFDDYVNNTGELKRSSHTDQMYRAQDFVAKWTLARSTMTRDMILANASSYEPLSRFFVFLDEYAMYIAEERIAELHAAAVLEQRRNNSIMRLNSQSSGTDSRDFFGDLTTEASAGETPGHSVDDSTATTPFT